MKTEEKDTHELLKDALESNRTLRAEVKKFKDMYLEQAKASAIKDGVMKFQGEYGQVKNPDLLAWAIGEELVAELGKDGKVSMRIHPDGPDEIYAINSMGNPMSVAERLKAMTQERPDLAPIFTRMDGTRPDGSRWGEQEPSSDPMERLKQERRAAGLDRLGEPQGKAPARPDNWDSMDTMQRLHWERKHFLRHGPADGGTNPRPDGEKGA